MQFLFCSNPSSYKLDNGLRRLAVPDACGVSARNLPHQGNEYRLTITRENNEFVIVAELVDSDVWESCHDLLLRREIGALFELEISNRSAKREIAINSAEIDEPTSRTDACLLAFVLRLVVKRQRFCSAFDTKN